MARSRISTGFHRIGVVIALPAVVAAAIFLIMQIVTPDGPRKALDELTTTERRVVRNGYEAREMSAGRTPLPESNMFWDMDEDTEATMPRRPNFYLPGFFLLVGVGAYAVCRAIGWIFDGFLGPNR